jgi:hypothetical protein
MIMTIFKPELPVLAAATATGGGAGGAGGLPAVCGLPHCGQKLALAASGNRQFEQKLAMVPSI